MTGILIGLAIAAIFAAVALHDVAHERSSLSQEERWRISGVRPEEHQ